MNHISLCSLAVLLIAGCTNLKQIENDQELVSNSIAEDVELVNQLRLDDRKYRNITMVQSIFVPPTTEAEQTKPDWWFDNVQSAANDVNLKTALKTVLSDHYINYQFQAGVDTTNKLINFKGKTVGGAIESIASASGYSYKVISDNKIIWSLYETRTFSIAAALALIFLPRARVRAKMPVMEIKTSAAVLNSRVPMVPMMPYKIPMKS